MQFPHSVRRVEPRECAATIGRQHGQPLARRGRVERLRQPRSKRILIGGEELHNNHHAYGTSAKFSAKWYEFDIGWVYIRILATLGLATVRKVAPKLKLESGKQAPDFDTLQAVITHRYAVLTSYARTLKASGSAKVPTVAN